MGLVEKKHICFYGHPSCGKSTIMAMSLYDKRHVVQVPYNIMTLKTYLKIIY